MADIELLGHFNSYVGVGEAARRLASLLSASGFGVSLGAFGKGSTASAGDLSLVDSRNATATTVVSCVNPDQLGVLLADNPKLLSRPLNHVGFWAWELPDFPHVFHSAFSMVDSVWTVSDFAKLSISRNSKVSVSKVRLPVPIPTKIFNRNRHHFGVPAKDFVVLSSFDFRSDFQRKNPLAGIEAFKCAFKPDTGATLILKSSNSAEFPEEFELVKQACANRTDIRLLNEILPVFENNLLLNCADVFLSLHRAEGYGINLIDSMARGIPVVATGFSGNLDYMNDANSVLVPFESKRVDFYAGVKVESTWAEPDINFASDKLRELFQDREMYSSISFQASKDIAKGHSLPMAVEQFRKEFTIA